MTRRVAILGAGGFIGRHLATRCARAGMDVLAATRRPVRFSSRNIRNVQSSFTHTEDFAPLVQDCDVIVHAAASSTPGSSDARPQLEDNLSTLLAMIEALQATPSCRLVYLSSGGTLYGNKTRPARESDPIQPLSYHGAGKAAAEHFIRAYADQYGGLAVILRPSNVYGPGQVAKPGFGIIPTALNCARSHTPITIWGDGSTVRDFLYIDDLVELCLQGLERPLPNGTHIFNASEGRGISLSSLLDIIDGVTGIPLTRHYAKPRRVDIHRITPDNSVARATFGWSPHVSLEEGLRRTWHWYTTQH